MKTVTKTQVWTFPTGNVSYSESIKTNYANFQSNSYTQNSDALINLIDGLNFFVESNETIIESTPQYCLEPKKT